MIRNSLRLLFVAVLFGVSSLTPPSSHAAKPSYQQAIIYYSSGCSMCGEFIDSDLLSVLQAAGVKSVIKKEYLNDPANRKELQELNQRLEIPPDLQGHITTIIDGKVLFEGHVPKSIMSDILFNEEQDLYERIAAYQDEMHLSVTSYKVWGWRGDIVEYPIATPVTEYFKLLKSDPSAPGKFVKMNTGLLLPVVLTAGLMDGINPCAFAVMAFLVAFLFTLRRTRSNIVQLGSAYIAAMYVTYFLIGLGILKMLVFVEQPHLISRLGAVAVVVLGLINMKDFFFPNLPIKLTIPMVAWDTLKEWMKKATLPSTLVVGALVGLCTLPCSGGIYVAILGLLTSQTTYLEGLGYLVLYNIMYIAPLIVILLLATSRPVAKNLAIWERGHTAQTRLAFGLIMVLLGLFIYLSM